MQAEIETLQPIVAEDRGRNAARPVSLGGCAGCVEQRPVVLDEARQRRLRQVEPVEGGVAPLELGDDAQAMTVVIEAPCAAMQASSASSPVCPKGVWPRSWPSATASARSSSSFSARASARAICATSIVWVRRVRK